MKKLNRSILRKINYLIGIILSAIGISSCEFRCEYGSPSAEFHISGRVENNLGKSIEGIKISVYNPQNSLDTTSADGSFKIDLYGHWPEEEITLFASDIDSTENGHYKTDTIYISPNYERDPNNSWNQIANIDNVVITLEEEKDNNNE